MAAKDTALSFSLGTDAERNQFVTDQLIAFNRAHSTATIPAEPAPVPEPIEIYAQDASGAIIGGLLGRMHTLRDWLEITTICVDEAMRGRGIGRELMERAEQEARQRGCRYARLATGNYQAPGFYEKLGYRLYGTLENCPPGVTCFYYWKAL